MSVRGKFFVFRMCVLACLVSFAKPAGAEEGGAPYDNKAAIDRSQSVLGQVLPDLELTDSNGKPFALGSLRGKPVVISLVFTSCYHVCPAITRHLADMVEETKSALGDEQFQVLTIGFDTPNDTPSAMAGFARQLSIDEPGWHFLSADANTMEALTQALGFTYFPTPRGFDHINQVTLVDRNGVVYRQVYGADFTLPALVEPLKELVFNRPVAEQTVSATLLDRIRLFCTVFDPASGRYRFDYSLFVQIAIGGIFLLVLAGWLLSETLRARRKNNPS